MPGPDGKPVAGATIKGVQGDKKSGGYGYDQVTTLTTSDAEGRYRLCTFSPDNYEIQSSWPESAWRGYPTSRSGATPPGRSTST